MCPFSGLQASLGLGVTLGAPGQQQAGICAWEAGRSDVSTAKSQGMCGPKLEK